MVAIAPKTFQCRFCKEEIFDKQGKLLNHIFYRHRETLSRPFECKFLNCKKTFSSPTTFLKHTNIHKEIIFRRVGSFKRKLIEYLCEFCPKRLRQKSKFIRHIQKEHAPSFEKQEEGERVSIQKTWECIFKFGRTFGYSTPLLSVTQSSSDNKEVEIQTQQDFNPDKTSFKEPLVHPSTPTPTPIPTPTPTPITKTLDLPPKKFFNHCPFCNNVYLNSNSWVKHMTLKHLDLYETNDTSSKKTWEIYLKFQSGMTKEEIQHLAKLGKSYLNEIGHLETPKQKTWSDRLDYLLKQSEKTAID